MTADDGRGSADLGIRPPLQARSRQVWTRILDAGVAIIEEGGYEAFTIAAICERANVAPPTVYARVDTKDALFLAVYEHGIGQVRDQEAVFADERRWADLNGARLVREAVAELAGIFHRHARFLGSVALISATHPEIRRQGSLHAQRVGRAFTSVVLRAGGRDGHDADRHLAADACFDMLFAALVLRVAYGPGFAVAQVDDETFTGQLADLAVSYLLRGP